ncbi:MAG TPA: SET domain-containing protein [Bacteroidia bacterium]|jgi:SET domain-containing protein|nr:SET domain-containing protein [Bacteroidia bacterium]
MEVGNYSNSLTYAIDAAEEDYLFVQQSTIEGAGKGLFTAVDIYKDEVICLYKGEYLSPEESLKRALIGEDRYFINMVEGGVMDSMHVHCFAKYANDVVGSTFKTNAKISLDEHDNVCIVATRKIKAGEEIFCSYGKRYWKRQREF